MATPLVESITMPMVPSGPTSKMPPSVVEIDGQANSHSVKGRASQSRRIFLLLSSSARRQSIRESGFKWNVGGWQVNHEAPMHRTLLPALFILSFVPSLARADSPTPKEVTLPSLAPLVDSVKSAVVNVDVQKRE